MLEWTVSLATVYFRFRESWVKVIWWKKAGKINEIKEKSGCTRGCKQYLDNLWKPNCSGG